MAITCTSDGPAKHRRAVVFCADAGYAPFAAFCAHQIAALHPNRAFDLCLAVSGEVDLPSSLAHLDLRICRIETGGVFSGLKIWPRFTEEVYLRLALPEAFAADYDRILYLDCDMFVQGGDLSALLSLDLGEHALGAVRDNVQWRNPSRNTRDFRKFGWPAEKYLNSGLLLIDVQRWNTLDLRAKCVEFGRRHADRQRAQDQALINLVLRGDWAELSPVWNWQYSPKSRLFTDLAEVNIIHFIRSTKPWRDPKGELSPRFLKGMLPFLQAHYPERDWPKPRQGPMMDAAAVRAIAWHHIVGYGRTARYLRRFPSDLTVYR